MSQAHEIFDMIQEDRNKLMSDWRGHDPQRYLFKCERDRTLEEIQDKILKKYREYFPEDFKTPKGAM